MKALTSTARLIHPLILVSAAFLVCANGAIAADFVGDAQMQAKALLAGTSGGRCGTADHRIATPSNDRQKSDRDPQELARQLIVYADASDPARRMIQGLGG